MSLTSANLDDLQTFITGSENRRGRVEGSFTPASRKSASVMINSSFQHPNTPSLRALDDLLATWRDNERFVKTIREELVQADRYDADGNPIVASAVIDAALKAKGLDDAPGVVGVDDIALYGTPPYSGWVDDPISMANGNFVLPEVDVRLPGGASALSVARTYNSRDPHVGAFGPGWSSVLDVALMAEDRRATVRLPDGGGAVFHRGDDGSWSVDHRRRLRLRDTEDGGWEVRQAHELRWRFDAEGTCTAFVAGAAEVSIERTASTVRLLDRRSERWVEYHLDADGQATRAETSDGRLATYERDSDGRVVAVRRPGGDVTYEHDEEGLLAAVVDADGILVCRNTYDAEGRVLSQVENHGRETRYEYRADGVATVTASDGAPPNVMVHDRRGRMTAMIDGLGNTMRVTYDDADNIVQLVDRAGAVTRFTHDERGNVTERIDPDGLTERFAWDEADRLVEHTDRRGGTTRFRYEGDGRDAVHVVRADGSEVHFAFDAGGLPTSVVDADGVAATLTWNQDGLVETIVDGLGGRLSFEYDAAGRPVRAVSPTGAVSALGFDRAGRPRTLRTPFGERTFEHTEAGRLVGGQLETGVRWRAELDGSGEVEAMSDTAGRLLTYERDTIGQVTATVAPDGGRARYEIDPVGRRTAVVDALGRRTEVGYDAEGRPVRTTDPLGRSWTRDLDELGRTVRAVGPDGSVTVRTHHAGGELASVTDARGRRWTYDVDVMGRVVSSTDPAGGVTRYGYTPGGRLAEVVSPLGRVIRRAYDAAGRLAKIIEPDGTEVLFERAADGATTRVTRAGVPTSMEYDETGRASAIAGPWGTVEIERTHGTLTGASRAGAAAHFEHDARGLLARAVDPAGVVTDFVHDACGRLVAHTTGAATTELTRDDAGLLVAVTDPYGNRTALERDALGVVEAVLRPDGTGIRRSFSPEGRLLGAHDETGTELLRVHHDAHGTVVGATAGDHEIHVATDVLGRTTEVGTDAGTVSYAWDADGYLLGLSDDSGHAVAIERDAGGNPVSFDVADGRRIPMPARADVERDEHRRIVRDEHGRTFDYDAAGRLAVATVAGRTTAYGYDDLGLLATERTEGGARQYRYGLAGELAELVHADGTRDTFDHDASGRRVREVGADGTETTYRWDAFGRLAGIERVDPEGRRTEDRIEHDPAGRPVRINGTPILWDRAVTGSLLGIGDQRFLRSGDQVLELGDPAGAWDRRVTDDPWGHDGGTGLRLGYRGELALDHLLFLGERVYDTRTRTFLSRDPLPSVPGAVTFAGVYSYAWNDPVNLVDPTGRRPVSDEDYQAWTEANTKGFLRDVAGDVGDWMKEHKGWIEVGMIVGSIVVMTVATVTLGPVGLIVAGAAVGALTSGTSAYLDGQPGDKILTSALIGGFFGGATAGLSRFVPASTSTSLITRTAQNVGYNGAFEMTAAFAEESVDAQYVDGSFDLQDALIKGTIGTALGTGGAEIDFRATEAFGLGGVDLLEGETADSLVGFDPGSFRTLDVNTATASELQQAHGIGPALSERIIEARRTSGSLSRQDLLDIPGIGEARLQGLIDAGLVP